MDFKGTGMSIGIDRLVFALNQINKLDLSSNGILVLVLDEKYLDEYYSIVNLLRDNIKLELIDMYAEANKKQINCNNQQLVDDNAKRIDKLEARYKEDDKFTITRAKIINFLEENNIE